MFKFVWNKKTKIGAGAAALVCGLFYATVEHMDAQIMPVEAKSPDEVQKVLEAGRKHNGCRSAEDFVNLNIMLREVDNPDLFNAVLSGVRFENGKLVYPAVAEQPHELMLVKRFFEKINITSEKDFRRCLMFVKNAKSYHVSQVEMYAFAQAAEVEVM